MTPPHESHPTDDVLYQWGTEELTARAQRKFVELFRDAPGKVLEVGCGKGIVLGIFKDFGVPAYGIDLSQTTVEYCLKKGLEAVYGDILSHIRAVPDNSLGGIFCAHVIEHMQPVEVIEFFHQSSRVLKEAGILLIITPNAQDLRTTERFWLDITHVRPYPRKLLHFLLSKEGFSEITSTNDREPARNILERAAKTFLRLWFMGYLFTGDLVVTAKR